MNARRLKAGLNRHQKAKTGLKDTKGRHIHRGERGGLYVVVNNQKRHLPPTHNAHRELLAMKIRASRFSDPITMNELPKRHGIVFNKQMYDPDALHKWANARGTVPHSRRVLNADERHAIKRASQLKHGHEGWAPLHSMFNGGGKANTSEDLRKVVGLVKQCLRSPGFYRGKISNARVEVDGEIEDEVHLRFVPLWWGSEEWAEAPLTIVFEIQGPRGRRTLRIQNIDVLERREFESWNAGGYARWEPIVPKLRRLANEVLANCRH
jgi:hypothetical protein